MYTILVNHSLCFPLLKNFILLIDFLTYDFAATCSKMKKRLNRYPYKKRYLYQYPGFRNHSDNTDTKEDKGVREGLQRSDRTFFMHSGGNTKHFGMQLRPFVQILMAEMLCRKERM